MSFAEKLIIDPAAEVKRIGIRLRQILGRELHRRGFVVAISGGVDSAVCAALAVNAVGPERVFGLLLPERDSAIESGLRGRMVAKQMGINFELFDIAPALEALGCYRKRDEAMRAIFPNYGPDWKSKIVIEGGREGGVNYFKLVVQTPAGEVLEGRLDRRNYLQIVAATNFKQRTRKIVEYFHADRLHYSVIGTPNRLEYDQGFFVKNGDGAADLKPIAHLYKTQVYQLARHLGIAKEICEAQPSTDTYSMVQGQDEFYFAMPYQKMDIALYALNHGVPVDQISRELELSTQQAEHVYRDIQAKRRTTGMLHWPALLVDPVTEPHMQPQAIAPGATLPLDVESIHAY